VKGQGQNRNRILESIEVPRPEEGGGAYIGRRRGGAGGNRTLPYRVVGLRSLFVCRKPYFLRCRKPHFANAHVQVQAPGAPSWIARGSAFLRIPETAVPQMSEAAFSQDPFWWKPHFCDRRRPRFCDWRKPPFFPHWLWLTAAPGAGAMALARFSPWFKGRRRGGGGAR
jgi:hypothetical protein